MMGLIGIIIASLVNIFKIIYDVLCYINLRGTNICRTYSYDTQKIKNMYVASDSGGS